MFTLGGRPLPCLARARVYVCGITPYDTTHLGHASTFVWVDTVARVLEHLGLEVQVCRNITDVDDDILAQASARDVGWQALATQQTYQFEDDMRKLRVRKPSYEPLSREYITEVIFLTRALLDRDAAYERQGNVYFRSSGVTERAGLDRAEALRLDADRGGDPDDPLKDDPLDAILWRHSDSGEPAWQSPWGDGRPGWHAECAAMATAILGLSVDIHAGGEDLAFPHHAFEAAMVETATGVAPFARSWMHIGTVTRAGEKIAKSTGNLVFVRDLLEQWQPEALRLLLVDRDWRTPWDFADADLESAAARLDELFAWAARPGGDAAADNAVVTALAHDLDVPTALAVAEEAGGSAARLAGKLLGIM
ncbi:MAG: cysteine--tRNA ligase [Actinobacteria bacterium]|nr:MAG: cysteine--tRNA ligase [Actinomycetota bacterium]RIK04040.1 MAG: cysteine--tRNA ligase [Acidobacteriota bacterium]